MPIDERSTSPQLLRELRAIRLERAQLRVDEDWAVLLLSVKLSDDEFRDAFNADKARHQRITRQGVRELRRRARARLEQSDPERVAKYDAEVATRRRKAVERNARREHKKARARVRFDVDGLG